MFVTFYRESLVTRTTTKIRTTNRDRLCSVYTVGGHHDQNTSLGVPTVEWL